MRKQPHTIINMAMTLDGKVSTISRTGAVFTSRNDKRRLAEIRADADALIMGAHTVIVDQPKMGITSPELREKRKAQKTKAEQPLRVILSASGSLPPDAKPFSVDWSPILVFTSEASTQQWRSEIENAVEPSGGRLFVLGRKSVPLAQMLEILYDQYGVRTAVCEGGPALNFQMIADDLVDDMYLTIAPLIFGGASALTPVEGTGFLPDQTRYATLISADNVDGELFLHYRLQKGPRRHDQRWETTDSSPDGKSADHPSTTRDPRI